ncbi:MAG: hypothetical protein GY835_26380 [bacterium]|nr:hypothetical protein [bacterium]
MRHALSFALCLLLTFGGTGPCFGLSLRFFPSWEQLLVEDITRATDSGALPRELFAPGFERLSRLRVDTDLDLLLRSRKADELHDYRSYGKRLYLLHARRHAWISLVASRNCTELRQRNTYSDDDRLVGDRNGDGLHLTAGLKRGRWALQLGLGRTRAWNGTASLVRVTGRGLLVLDAGSVSHDWRLEQAFLGKRFRFDFPLRGERLAFGFRSAAKGWPSLTLRREVTYCNLERAGGDFNRIFAKRYGGNLDWRLPVLDAQLAATLDHGYLGLNMFADGNRYLRLDRLDLHTHTLELRLPLPQRTRLLLGQGERVAHVDDGLVKLWPFTFWDIFTNSRYDLDELHYRLLTWSVGAARTFDLPGDGRLTCELRHQWLAGGGHVDWKERVMIVWPHIFGYEYHRATLPLPATRLLRLDLTAQLPLPSDWVIEVGLRQLAPLDNLGSSGDGEENPSVPPPAEGDESFVFGGIEFRLGVERVRSR